MKYSVLLTLLITLLLFSPLIESRELVNPTLLAGQVLSAGAQPAYCHAIHDMGKIRVVVQNRGVFGVWRDSFSQTLADCFTGERIDEGVEYPKGSGIEHLLYASLWIGAVRGDDTLVSTGMEGWGDGRELHPDVSPIGNMIHRSIIDPDAPEYQDAVSEQDFIAVYSDTLRGTSRDYFYSRPHDPLYIEVTQRSFAWSYPYAEDIVLVDLAIRNIGPRNLRDVYVGLYVDADVGYNPGYRNDDLTGYLKTYPFKTNCGDIEDTVNIAWAADNNGDPIDGKFKVDLGVGEPSLIIQRKSAPFGFGTRVLRSPNDITPPSFNWWIANYDPRYDFGPRHQKDFRDFKTGAIGTPEGDLNKYHMLSNGEVDYDQALIAEIDSRDQIWLVPGLVTAYRISRGADTRYLQSFGPFDIQTTESVPLTFAFFIGENFHNVIGNGGLLYYQPYKYYGNLDFNDLVDNSRWASWIFDNPGIDTDGDGYAGKFQECILESTLIEDEWFVTQADTVFYKGDGIPDFKGAAPPPAPFVEVTPQVGALHVRFNGQRSETTKDFLTNSIDFEGYHVWIARDDRATSYTQLASYDRVNYDKFIWNRYNLPGGRFELHELPFTEDSLRCAYGNSCDDPWFKPEQYSVGHPYVHPEYPDSIFYFAPHGNNTDQWAQNTPINRVYPDEPFPPRGTDLDTLSAEWFTKEGNLKSYEYELTINNLLSSVPYYVSVTAFDFGSPQSDIEALETSVTLKAVTRYPLSGEEQLTSNQKIYVYPNPYRKDENYLGHGYEGRTDDRPEYRLRRLRFVNLPPSCTIQIFSLDGDLVRELNHEMDPSDPNSIYDEWDLISRNTQEIVSGLYYWVVQNNKTGETQIGKFVVLL